MPAQMDAKEGAILKGADTVHTTRESLEQQLKQVESNMASIGSQWQGNAAVAFHSLMNRWNEEARKVTSALIEFENNLRQTQTKFDATDSEQQDVMSKISARLS